MSDSRKKRCDPKVARFEAYFKVDSESTKNKQSETFLDSLFLQYRIIRFLNVSPMIHPFHQQKLHRSF